MYLMCGAVLWLLSKYSESGEMKKRTQWFEQSVRQLKSAQMETAHAQQTKTDFLSFSTLKERSSRR